MEVAGAALVRAEDERLEDAVALPRAHGDRARPAPLWDPEAAVDPPVAAQLDHELAAVVGGVLPLPQQPQRARARKAPRLQLAQRAPRHLRRAAFAREARDEERAAAADRRADDEVEELAHRLARQLLHLLDHRQLRHAAHPAAVEAQDVERAPAARRERHAVERRVRAPPALAQQPRPVGEEVAQRVNVGREAAPAVEVHDEPAQGREGGGGLRRHGSQTHKAG